MTNSPARQQRRFWSRNRTADPATMVETATAAPIEVRDPSAATTPIQYTTPGRPMVTEWDALTAIKWAFYANVIVYRSTQIIANIVASCPFRAGKQPPTRPGLTVESNERSRLAQLLGPPPGGPAPKLSSRRLWAWTAAQRIVTGRHGWEIETAEPRKADAEVVALWPLVSPSIRPIPTESGTEWFSAFEYGRPEQPKILRPDQIVYGWDPRLDDFRQPESRLQAARLDVSIAVMMDRYNYGFLRNDARPASVVVVEAFDNEQEFRRFKDQWHGEFGGPDNAGRTAFAEVAGAQDGGVKGMIDVKVLGLSQKDARFIEQHRASLERVAMAIGVPWSLLDASGRTFDNAGEEAHNFWEQTMLPFMADLQDEINMQLAPRLGREVGWFDLSHVKALQPEPRVTAVGAPSLLTSRLVTIDEGRAMVGLQPLPEGAGNRFLSDEEIAVLNGRVLPVEAPDTTPPEAPDEDQSPAADDAANTARSTPTDPPSPVQQAAAQVVRLAPSPARATPEEHAERRARIWRRTDATVRSLESRWERAWRRMFERQERATISRLEGNRGRRIVERRATADEVFDRQHWVDESQDEAAGLYELVATSGFARISDMFAVDFDLEADYAQDFIRARANQLAGDVTETTYEAIKAALADGVDAGEGIPELAKRVRHVFEIATKTRSVTIARTEVISAFNGSATLAATQLPEDIAAGREWISTPDARTRDDHAAADGQVVGMDAAFDVGGESLFYPGDPSASPEQVVNCRCTVGILTPDEMAERSAVAHGRRVRADVATAVLAMVRPGEPFDELAVRRALKEVAA